MNFPRSFSRLALVAIASAVLILGAPPAHAQIVTLTVTASQSSATVNPGTSNVTLLAIAIKNNSLALSPRTLTGLQLGNTTTGPGPNVSRDLELGSVRLYRDANGDGRFDATDVQLGQPSAASSGTVSFTSLNESIASGATLNLVAVSNVPLGVRDGDALDLSVAAVAITPSTTFTNAFPVEADGSFPIDGLVAAQVTAAAPGPLTIRAGTTDNVALELLLPANGYEPDQLRQLAVINEGTAAAGADLQAVRAWVDDGDGVFSPKADRPLGSLVFTGSRWQNTGLTEAVPVKGLHLFLTADVPTFATNGSTIQLAIPSRPDLGIGMSSDDDGPLDRSIEQPKPLTISTADRVTWSAKTIPPATVHPGDRGVPLLDLMAANAYGTPQRLRSLTVTNAGVSGSQADRDHAIQVLTLRADGNGDGQLGGLAADPILGTAFFAAGVATFGGLAYDLPPGVTKHLFVTADASLTGAADQDTLSANVAGPLDVTLDDTTRVVANWPLDSGARAAVDGMVAAQLAVAAVPNVPVAPNDANVLALDLIVPRNGHSDDVSQSLTVTNSGSAANGDVAELRWWRDGGDGVRTPGGGDDQDLGPATWNGAGWTLGALAEPLGASGARLFAALRMTATAADSVTIHLGVPVNGIRVLSGNDGPIDAAVLSPTTLVVSNSPLLAVLSIVPAASTVGQTVSASMEVRNGGTESINGVTPSALTPSGSGSLAPLTGPTPASVSLAPGVRDTIRWTYRAASPGTVRLAGSASGTGSPSGITRQTLQAISGPHQVFAQASALSGEATWSVPVTVTRGQSGLTVLTLRLSNPSPQAAPVRFRGFRVALLDETGAGVVPASLLSRVAVQEGTTVRLSRTSLETSGSGIDLTLASPVRIDGGETSTLTLVFDLLASTTETNFRVAVLDSSWFTAEDANNGAPVSVQVSGASFPLMSTVARVVESPTRVDIAAPAGPPASVGPSQPDVPMLTLRLMNPGTDGITGDARVFAIALDAGDTLGARLALLANAISWIRVRSAGQTLVSRAVSSADGPRLSLTLNPAVTLPVNVPVDLLLSGDVATAAAGSAFQLRLADSSGVNARDANTFAPIAVALAASPLPGPTRVVEEPADTLIVGGTPRMPAGVLAGDAGVAALGVVVRHPGAPGTSDAHLDSLVVRVRDGAGGPLSPAAYLSRLRVLRNGVEIGARNDPPVTGEAVGIPLGGQILSAGANLTLELVVDFSAAAPAGSLQLATLGDDFFASDAHLGTRLVMVPSSGAFPFSSGVTQVQAPARTLVVSLSSLLPAALATDGHPVAAATLTLTNPAPPGAGDIRLDHLTLRAADGALAARAVGAIAGSITVHLGGGVWAQSAALTADSVTATIDAGTPLSVSPGAPVTLELRFTPAAGAAGGARLGIDAAGVGVLQPGSALLQVQVQPATGSAFPLWTEVGHFGPLDLAASYSNFPNPFAAGREATRFAYYLDHPARVWLRISALDGEAVKTLIDGQSRDAGLRQEDGWDGRNGAGHTVRNGVYVAELVVEYDGGRGAHALRKVAVVR